MRSTSRNASPLSISGQRVGPRLVLTVAGEVDISGVDDLQRALATARDGDASEIWLDLTSTRFIDCRGLHALLDLRAGLLRDDRRLVLICPAGPVLRLLLLTGTDRDFEIHSAAPPSDDPRAAR